jgi:hypothetical protein
MGFIFDFLFFHRLTSFYHIEAASAFWIKSVRFDASGFSKPDVGKFEKDKAASR